MGEIKGKEEIIAFGQRLGHLDGKRRIGCQQILMAYPHPIRLRKFHPIMKVVVFGANIFVKLLS